MYVRHVSSKVIVKKLGPIQVWCQNKSSTCEHINIVLIFCNVTFYYEKVYYFLRDTFFRFAFSLATMSSRGVAQSIALLIPDDFYF